jgi:hypothetical protein
MYILIKEIAASRTNRERESEETFEMKTWCQTFSLEWETVSMTERVMVLNILLAGQGQKEGANYLE